MAPGQGGPLGVVGLGQDRGSGGPGPPMAVAPARGGDGLRVQAEEAGVADMVNERFRPVRPEDLARELGVTGLKLRNWLRKTYPRAPVEHGDPWYLTEEQVGAARDRFRS